MCACGGDKRTGWRQCCDSLNLRKLYEVYVNNGLEYGDESHFTVIVVAKNERDAEEKVKQTREFEYHNTHNAWIDVEELDIVDGYRIKLEKI